MLDGFSIFVNSEMEETLDDALTLFSGDKSLMQIEIRQENRKLLGDPFTTCEDPNETLLNHYAIYERKNCLTECLIIHKRNYFLDNNSINRLQKFLIFLQEKNQ